MNLYIHTKVYTLYAVSIENNLYKCIVPQNTVKQLINLIIYFSPLSGLFAQLKQLRLFAY